MFARCNFCGRRGPGRSEHTISTNPGGGQIFTICKVCFEEGKLPQSFNEKRGIDNQLSNSNAKLIRYVGKPQITDGSYGLNAFGSIVAEYDDGSRLAVCCSHGGSEWLCLECAIKGIRDQSVRDCYETGGIK